MIKKIFSALLIILALIYAANVVKLDAVVIIIMIGVGVLGSYPLIKRKPKQ